MNLLRPAKKGQLTNYALFIASRWFETIDDFINVEKGCKRFLGNTSRFFYNPISLNKKTREFFPYLQTLYVYKNEDEQFKDDKQIQRRKEIKIDDFFAEIIGQLRKVTNMGIKRMIFDSNIHKWEKNNSEL